MKQLLIFILSIACVAQAESIISDSLTTPPVVKSEIAAYGWALGGTLIPLIPGLIIAQDAFLPGNTESDQILPILLIGSGLLVGPSLGQFYIGPPAHAWLGIAGRALGMGIFIAGILQNSAAYDNQSGEVEFLSPQSRVLLLTGVFFLDAGIVYSLIDPHFAMKRANKKIKAQHFGFSPELFPSSDGGLKPGVLVWAKF